jgi:predicted PurR-regulated permease PerM
MIWHKRVLVGFLSVVLLFSLVGLAFSVSARFTLANPKKVISWINQSGLYDYINNRVINQAQQAVDSSNQSSQLNAVISNNVKSALPPSTIQQDINNIVINNYAWLEGKSNVPNFKIDLTSAKQEFAKNMGTYTQTRLASLPICSLSQTLKIKDPNPLTLT